jgi:hypothetical protein
LSNTCRIFRNKQYHDGSYVLLSTDSADTTEEMASPVFTLFGSRKVGSTIYAFDLFSLRTFSSSDSGVKVTVLVDFLVIAKHAGTHNLVDAILPAQLGNSFTTSCGLSNGAFTPRSASHTKTAFSRVPSR